MRYKDAGVNIGAAARAKSKIRTLAHTTLNPRVLAGVGGFGGLFALHGLGPDPVLVASIDGVGTKLKIAFEMNRHGTVGADLVNHCVNDIAVHGARPLFFLDYLATGRLQPAIAAEIVTGIARACRETGCALIGGETAEMPGFYPDKEYDLAGCIVGWVQRRRIVDGSRVRPGDWILALPSLGLHTNGYSLARKVLLETSGIKLNRRVRELGRTLGDELLAPHRCYGPVLWPLLDNGWIAGLAHITGGGITDNLPRALPAACRAHIALGSWPVPAIFRLIAELGRIPEDEMLRTFNMGAGMLLIVSPKRLEQVITSLKEAAEDFHIVGRIERGRRSVKYQRDISCIMRGRR